MKKLNKILYAAVMILSLAVQGCSSGSSDDYDEPPVPVQPGDNVVFSNQTEFAVKVYSDSMRSVLVTDVAAKGSVSLHVDVVAAGNVFYFSYFMDVNGVSVPYSVTDGQTVLLNDSSATSVKITDPESVNTKNRIILLKNEASSAIVLNNGNKEEIPEGKSSALINSGDYGVYMLKVTDAVENIRVSEGAKSVSLSTAADFENGYIYTIVYDGTKIYMRSKSFLDRNMNKKIWKIGVSQEAGKTLRITYFGKRKNGQGYTVMGKIGYNPATINNQSSPYFASIDSVGTVSDLVFDFKDKPISSLFSSIAESNEMSLILGENFYSDDKWNCFVMADNNGYSIYKSIAESSEECIYDSVSIIHKVDRIFCVLLNASKEDGDLYQLIEVSIDGYDKASVKKVYESEVDGTFRRAHGVVYDSTQDSYIVLFQEEMERSVFSFIDANSGEKKSKDLVLDNYRFWDMKMMPGTIYVYATGSYINQISSKDVASFAKINVLTGSVVGEKPMLYPARSPSLNSSFYSLTIKDKEVVFVGCTDADYAQDYVAFSEAYPLIVSYSLDDNSKLYEQIYDGMKGFVINRVDNSELDTLFLDLWNSDTDETYIVSTGFLGSLPEDVRLILPYTIKSEMAVPNLTIKFYNDSSSYEAYNETAFKYGTTIELADLEQYANAPAGYSVAGWYNWISFDNEEILFPLTVDKTLYLYPKVMRDVSVFVYSSYDAAENEYIAERTFKYGTNAVLSDLQDCYTPADGYTVIDWYYWNNRNGDTAVSFPIKMTDTVCLYPKVRISPPTGVCGWATSDSEIYVQWDAHPVSQSYYLYWRDNYGNSGGTPVSNAASCTISGLNSGASYTIEVIAYDNSKAEWSERSAECTIQTETATNWGDIPSYAEELPLNTGGINTHVYLNPGDVHYYYAYFEAGRSYCVWWADSYEGMEYLEDWELTPCADAAVSVYYAGDAEADFIDSGYIVPYEICCSRSGYYLIELRGFSSDAKGWCAITCYEKIE